jgi:histone H3/H4
MGKVKLAAYITVEEARQLVRSLPERAQRLDVKVTYPEQNTSMIPLGSIAVGSVLTATAFSKRIPDHFRCMAAAGAIMSAGALALFSLSTLISSYDKVAPEKPFDRLLRKLATDSQLKEEMAQYFAQHITNAEMDLHNKADIIIMGQALRFCEQKKLIKNLSYAEQDALRKEWSHRDYSHNSADTLSVGTGV